MRVLLAPMEGVLDSLVRELLSSLTAEKVKSFTDFLQVN